MDSHKQLYRSSSNRIIGGVCGGIAEYIDMDATVIRLIFMLFVLLGGAGILIYIIAWIIIPTAPLTNATEANMPEQTNDKSDHEADSEPEHLRYRYRRHSRQGRMGAGVLLIVIGSLFLIQQISGVNVWQYSWPLILIVLGLLIIVRRS
jgi:phage shock protein C